MTLTSDLHAALMSVARRSLAVRAFCLNEESTKQHMVLPVLAALGYDYTDPFVVQPEFVADFRKDAANRVDYVIINNDAPVIAIECKKVGSDLSEYRGQLRAYFTALRTVRLGILTDGMIFEFFADWENENIMDLEPFAVLDLGSAASGIIPSDVVEVLTYTHRDNFSADVIAEIAEHKLLARRLRAVLVSEFKEPSEEFCRLALQRVGLTNVRRTSIRTRYSSLIRSALQEALVFPVVEHLRRSSPVQAPQSNSDDTAAADGIVTTDRELAVYRYVCRRLAYLAKDEHQFSAIERVGYKDYIGKFVVYYENVRKGRIFDFFEGGNGYDKFVFPAPYGEIVTNSVSAIDEALKDTFFTRVREVSAPRISDNRATSQV